MDKVLERIVACIGPKHGAKKELADYLGIHPNVITNWLGGRNKSYMKYLEQIANFYNVSEHYLKTGEEEQKEKPAATEDDELSEYLEELKNRPEMRMLFSLTKGATKEDVERAVRIIEAALGK